MSLEECSEGEVFAWCVSRKVSNDSPGLLEVGGDRGDVGRVSCFGGCWGGVEEQQVVEVVGVVKNGRRCHRLSRNCSSELGRIADVNHKTVRKERTRVAKR